jgi:PAS domain-containing protein
MGLDPAYVATDDVGVITAMSPRAEDLLGVKAKDAVGAHIAQAIPAGNIEGQPILSGDNSLLARCLATGSPGARRCAAWTSRSTVRTTRAACA